MKRAQLFVVAALAVTISRKGNAQQVTVPAFFGFTSSQNQTDWNNIQNAYGNVKIVVADFGAVSDTPSAAESRLSTLNASTAQRSAHIIANVPTTTNRLQDIACAAESRNWPSIYVYDGSTSSYDHLSPLFNQTVSTLASTWSGPDPSTVSCGEEVYNACGVDTGNMGTDCSWAGPNMYCLYCYGGFWECASSENCS